MKETFKKKSIIAEFTKTDKENIGKVFDFKKESPFIISAENLPKVAKIFKECIDVIENSENPRSIVSETWIMLDFGLRQMLLTGLELTDFCHSDLAKCYDLLPKSFVECLEMLEKLLKSERDLDPPKGISHTLQINVGFAGFLLSRDENILKTLRSMEQGYLNQQDNSDNLDLPHYDNKNSRKVNENWIKALEPINHEWFEKAKKLNKSRNIACHFYDDAKLYSIFGICGENNQLEDLRRKCKSLILDLFNLKTD